MDALGIDSGTSLNITPQDRDIAIRTMIGEENAPDGMAGVASVLLNRAASGKYGSNSLSGVAFAPNQFDSWDNPQKLLAIPQNDPQYQRAAKIFDGVASGEIPDLTSGSTNFYAPKLQSQLGRNPPSWAQSAPNASLGSSQFYAPNGSTSYKPPAQQTSAAPKVAAPTSDPFDDYPTTSASAPAPEAAIPGSEKNMSVGVLHSPPPSAQPSQASSKAPTASLIASADPFEDYPTSAPVAIAEAPTAASPAPSVADTALGGARSTAEGIPVIGGLLNKADAATDAALSYALNPLYAPQDQLTGSFGNRYGQALATQEGMDQSFAQAHPVAAQVLPVAGAVAGMAPAMVYAPAALGLGVPDLGAATLLSGASGAAIGGTDSAIRSSGDLNAIKNGALWGGVGGLAGPITGRFAEGGINRVANLFTKTNPAARNVANVFTDAGMTPADAQAVLARMGPNATLADVDPLLAQHAGGLASQGGAPTSILKNAFGTRAAAADDRASQLLTKTLGPKPDINASIEAVQNDAANRAAPYYDAGRTGPAMDVTPVLASIDQQMPNASGATANVLNTVKGYLTNKTATANNPLGVVPKDDPGSILGARQALDDLIERRGNEETSAGKNALRVAGQLRSQLDGIVKSNPNFAQGDAIYADSMKVRDALQDGQDVFKRATRPEDLQRTVASMNPQQLNAFRQGARVAIADTMENASRGEMSAALGMFSRGTANRAKLNILFPNAQDALDAIHSEAAMRSTEQQVTQNSATAGRQAIHNLYASKQGGGGVGAAAPIVGEAIYGGPGAIAATGAKAAGGAIKNAFEEAAVRKLTEGTAKGLSATGREQAQFLKQVGRAARTNRAVNLLAGVGNKRANLLARGVPMAGMNLLGGYYQPAR